MDRWTQRRADYGWLILGLSTIVGLFQHVSLWQVMGPCHNIESHACFWIHNGCNRKSIANNALIACRVSNHTHQQAVELEIWWKLELE